MVFHRENVMISEIKTVTFARMQMKRGIHHFDPPIFVQYMSNSLAMMEEDDIFFVCF